MKSNLHIALLAASIKPNSSGRWVSADLTEEDSDHGAPGGTLRVVAAALLLREYPEARVITGGAKGFDVRIGLSEDRPLLAEILRDELLAQGISEDRMILQRTSNSTHQELKELERIAGELGLSQLTILTSRWHIPRLEVMINYKFAQFHQSICLKLVAAEDVLIAHNSRKWQTVIQSAYDSNWMKQRTEMEARGIQQIIDGTYVFR